MGRASVAQILSEFEPFERTGRLLNAGDSSRRRTLNAWASAGRLISPYPGLFARPDFWLGMNRTQREICRLTTLASLHPQWVFCSYSAAVLRGLSVSYRLLDKVHVALPNGRLGHSTAALRYHRSEGLIASIAEQGGQGICTSEAAKAPSSGDAVKSHSKSDAAADPSAIAEAPGSAAGGFPAQRIDVQGCSTEAIPVTSLETTVAECLRDAPFRRGLAIADSALRSAQLSDGLGAQLCAGRSAQLCADSIEALLEGPYRRHPGVRKAKKTLSHADGRAESGGESMIRAAMIEQGFMVPELQIEFTDPVDPSRHFRVDFLWTLPDGRRVIGEFDGKAKYEAEEMTVGRSRSEVEDAERQRESRLTLLGMPVVRFNARDLRTPALFARKLRVAGIPQDESRGFPTDVRDL